MQTNQPPTAVDFQRELDAIFELARENNLPSIVVKSGKLHSQAVGYPATNHRMPLCCYVMRKNMKPDDAVLSEPPSGQGATLRIRYLLPR